MLVQKLFRVLLPVDRNRKRELRRNRFNGFNNRSAVQEPLEFRNEIQVIEDFVSFILPGGQGNRVVKQLSPTVGVIANPSRHSSKKCDGRGLESILKQQSEIESSPAPFAHLIPGRAQPLPIVN